MKHFAAALLLAATAVLSGLDIDLHKYRVRQGKYEFTKEGEDKMVKIYSLPKVRSCYVTFNVPLQPFHRYELSFEMRGNNITRRPSKSLFGGGVTFFGGVSPKTSCSAAMNSGSIYLSSLAD